MFTLLHSYEQYGFRCSGSESASNIRTPDHCWYPTARPRTEIIAASNLARDTTNINVSFFGGTRKVVCTTRSLEIRFYLRGST